jgi:hypothetical protein
MAKSNHNNKDAQLTPCCSICSVPPGMTTCPSCWQLWIHT